MARRPVLQNEAAIHSQIVQYLALLEKQGRIRFFHPANEGKRGFVAQRAFKALGGSAGIPDLCIVGYATVAFIEVKSATGRTTDTQSAWLSYLDSCGIPNVVVRDFDEARSFIDAVVGRSDALKLANNPAAGAA